MGSKLKFACVALICITALPSYADDIDDSDPLGVDVTVVLFGSAKSKDADVVRDTLLVPLRKSWAAANVLFYEVDLSTTASAHQARLMLSATGLGTIYTSYKKKPGVAVIWDNFTEKVVLELTAKSKLDAAQGAIKRAVSPIEEDADD